MEAEKPGSLLIEPAGSVMVAVDQQRRRMIVVFTLFSVPMLSLFAMFEASMQRLDMVAILSVAAGICLFNLHLARQRSPGRWVLRASLAYMYLMVIYYIQEDFLSSSLLFALVLPFLSAYLLGHRESAVWNALFGGAVAVMILYAEWLGLSTLAGLDVDFIATYAFVALIAFSYERARSSMLVTAVTERARLIEEVESRQQITEKNDRLFNDLQHALREVRDLTGLIPICASCKKVRSDEDFWENVEGYLHRRTQLTFSHSLCPCCSDRAMAEMDADEGVNEAHATPVAPKS